MPSTSKKQRNFMAAAAHNPAFAKKVGISTDVAKEFNQADKGKKFKEGGFMKPVDSEENPGLSKLPTEVRNKMGYMKKGGLMKHDDIKQDMPMMKKVAKQEVKAHEKSMHKMASGGKVGQLSKADGCATKGKSKGTMITMKSGGMC
jgi:hypothetical protein